MRDTDDWRTIEEQTSLKDWPEFQGKLQFQFSESLDRYRYRLMEYTIGGTEILEQGTQTDYVGLVCRIIINKRTWKAKYSENSKLHSST